MGKDNKKKFGKNGGHNSQKQHEIEAKGKKSIKQNNTEQAGTINDSDIPELTRQANEDSDREKQPNLIRQSRFKMFKPFIVAAVSALVIGSVLGFFMLNMFVDVNENISTQGSSSSLAAAEEQKDSAEENDGSLATIASSSAFVLQAGKFSEQENAKQMQKTFAQQSFPSMIWEKDAYFYVFAGITDSAENGNQLAERFTEKGLEVYVTEWETGAQEIALTDTEEDWLQLYDEQWKDSIASIKDNNKLSQEKWSDIIDRLPGDSEHLADFSNLLTNQYQEMKEADQWESQVILLNLWNHTSKLAAQS